MMLSICRQSPQLAGTHLTLHRGLRVQFLLTRDGAEQKETVAEDVELGAAESELDLKWGVWDKGDIAAQKM